MKRQRRRTNRQRQCFLAEQLEQRNLLAGVITQVGYFDTWDGGIIPSTDVAGVTYHAPSGTLYLADSEINEMPEFTGSNIFQTTLAGDQLIQEIASNNSEPTGITYNEFDGYFYVSNDNAPKTVTRYDANLNNPLLVISTKDDVSNATDPEGVSSNPLNGDIYVVDGSLGGMQVLTYNSNLQFQSVFSVAGQMNDAEGIAYHQPSDHLFVVDGNQDMIFEYTLNGTFVEFYDINGFTPNARSPQGLSFGPTSNPNDDPSELSLYIADGMTDNYTDGRIFEAVIGNSQHINQPPTTIGIPDVNVNVDAPNSVINLFDAFDDFEDPDSLLTYTIQNNSNLGLFASTTINGTLGTLTLDFAAATEGSAMITVRAADTGTPSLFVEASFAVNVTPVNPNDPVTINVRVAGSTDDAEERPSGTIKITSSDLELTQDGVHQQVVGLRFANLNIPLGANIQNAYIQFQADEANSDPTNLNIRGQAVDNAVTFNTTNSNVSSRVKTSAGVSWSPAPWTAAGQAGVDQRTPNIAAVIQEIINRPGWTNGNSLAIILDGIGKRVAEAFDGVAAAAPLLHVEYVTGNLNPTTTGIPNVNVNTNAPNTVIDLFAAFDDYEDPDAALTYTIQNNTNFALFSSTNINSGQGTLTLDYAAATNGSASLTIRATDTGDLFVETTFNVVISPPNQAPTTSGIPDVFVVEDAANQVLNLFAAFADAEDPDSALTYTIQANTNPSLFTSAAVNGGAGTLTLDFAPNANGAGNITVRATDTGYPVMFVETTFTVYVSEVNDAPILTAGTIGNLTVVQNANATSLGLAGVSYGPGGANDENGQSLSYAVTSVPAPSLGNIVLANGSTIVSSGAYTLTQIRGMQFVPAANVFGGPETFQFTVTDNGTTNGSANFQSLSQSIAINVIENLPDPIIVNVRVASSADDAEERPSGSIKITSSDLELTQDGVSQQIVGLRFANLNIPLGASIQNAYIQFQADEVNSDLTNLNIRGQAADNANTFTTTRNDVSSRQKTSASVPWAPAPWTSKGEAGADQRTPNIAAVIQEIINRPGWSNGNSLAVILDGVGKRVAEAFDGDSSAAPLLHIEYVVDQANLMLSATPSDNRIPQADLTPLAPVKSIVSNQLDPIAKAALAILAQTIQTDVSSQLAGLVIEVVDLPGNVLGRATANTIQIDINAGGFGWFIDATPFDNSEFSFDFESNQFTANSKSRANDRVDLLTVMLHELEHLLGSEHSNGLMDASLPLGTRRLPITPTSFDTFFETHQLDEGFSKLMDSSFEDLRKRRW